MVASRSCIIVTASAKAMGLAFADNDETRRGAPINERVTDNARFFANGDEIKR
jgi:hypothetical protein